MNERSDLDRVLRHWLADGPSQMPDRVLETVADRIDRQPQRRAWRLQRRQLEMNSMIRIGAAIAAVLVLAIVGWNMLPGRSTGVGGPPSTTTTSPTPSATATPTPSASPASASPATARMVVQGKTVSWTVTVPPGWTGAGQWALMGPQGPSGPSGIAVAAPGGINVPTDPCDGVGKVSDAKTPADVVAALRSRQDLVVSSATDAMLGGYAGLRVDVQVPADLSACRDLYIIFAEPDGTGFSAQGPANQIRMWILDVEGHPTVFQIESFAGTPAGDKADAQRIVDSIVITP